MFSIRQIRAMARQTINSIPGIFLLPLIPVGISLIVNIMRYTSSENVSLIYDQGARSSYIFSSISFPVLYDLLFALLNLAIARTLFQIIRAGKQSTGYKDILEFFNSPDFGKIFRTFLVKQFFLFLWSLISLIGVGLIMSGSVLMLDQALKAENPADIPDTILVTFLLLFFGGLLILLIGLAIYIPQELAYSQTDYILFEQLEKNEYAGARPILKSSRQMMRGFKWKRFVLDLSFIGWFILQGITFGIAGIYVLPYYYAAQVHFYQAVKNFHLITQTGLQPSIDDSLM